ncbi:MAG: hypothetical protein WCE61_08610 [Candidatus Acidiferrum sp.]
MLSGRVEHPSFLELQQRGIVASLKILLDSGPVSASKTGLTRIPSRDPFLALGTEDYHDTQKMIRLRRNKAPVPFSQRWTSEL